MAPKPITLTDHARNVIKERAIEGDWWILTALNPDWVEPDASDPTLE